MRKKEAGRVELSRGYGYVYGTDIPYVVTSLQNSMWPFRFIGQREAEDDPRRWAVARGIIAKGRNEKLFEA